MAALEPSPRMIFHTADKLRTSETFLKIKDMKKSGFRLKGSLLIADGRTVLIFHEDPERMVAKMFLMNAKIIRIRSFSCHM